VRWEVDLHDDVVPEFDALDEAVRKAIVLCGGDKSGGSEKRFYRQLIAKADERFDAHLTAMKQSNVERPEPKTRKRRP
jgi:hypothetical protein